eukprot:CAMPEP_0184871572 /NCGR_PEP_ID=MMETSP0580-20130426/40796_1 /TAXON_ID=1118495 /ORGANISM="Dactyliosolen fragilissimus" /LENGTH=261 /DNA_ID=CAMNT_0027374249 /DNA_START=473 /DNA_END=1259 /DNA_ORIENTATION=+
MDDVDHRPPNEQNNNDHGFHIHGWKWHTLSLVRDCNRLHQLAKTINESIGRHGSKDDVSSFSQASYFPAPLEKAIYHVIDFNMAALTNIEDKLFFPWLINKLCDENDSMDESIKNSFRYVFKQMDRLRMEAKKSRKVIAKLATTSQSSFTYQEDLIAISELAANLSRIMSVILHLEVNLIIPAVSKVVPYREQDFFNKRVLIKLGLLDSRIHLVGMRDAVWESGDDAERDLFDTAIPYIPRMMIPRWRRNLYDPQAGDLNI